MRIKITKLLSKRAEALLEVNKIYNAMVIAYDADYLNVIVDDHYRGFNDSDIEYIVLVDGVNPNTIILDEAQELDSHSSWWVDQTSTFELPKGTWNVTMGPITTSNTEKIEPVCECGTTKTLGSQDNPEFHSRWCPIFKERG